MRLRWERSRATRNWYVARVDSGPVPDNIFVWQRQDRTWVSSNTSGVWFLSAREAMRAAQRAYSELIMKIAEARLHNPLALHKTTDA